MPMRRHFIIPYPAASHSNHPNDGLVHSYSLGLMGPSGKTATRHQHPLSKLTNVSVSNPQLF
ncbi:hypothetical protein GGC63_005063 [Paenibacillus sp. OAS669]|nr:hypothetical protein [Paenibacillus sp. OAS669]